MIVFLCPLISHIVNSEIQGNVVIDFLTRNVVHFHFEVWVEDIPSNLFPLLLSNILLFDFFLLHWETNNKGNYEQ